MEELFWVKYRPKNINDLILLDRVRNLVSGPISNNLLFHGSYGMGKTVLSKFLIDPKLDLMLNSSLDTSINVLREDIDSYCSTYDVFSGRENKMVFMDEMDRVSAEFQDALKGFVEENENRVRFIATTNHIKKITDGIKSRFLLIDFDPRNSEEKLFLKKKYCERLKYVAEQENINIDDTGIVDIVNRNFPDMRSMLKLLQATKVSGETITNLTDNQTQSNLYTFLTSPKTVYDCYEFVSSNYSNTNLEEVFQHLGRNFIEYIYLNCQNKIGNLGKINSTISNAMSVYYTHLDPLVLASDTLFKINYFLNT